MLSALADEHVKFAIVAGLRLRGMDVITVQEGGLTKTPDDQILIEATRLGRILLTNDTDFLRIDAEFAKAGRSHAGIVFWSQAGRQIGEVIRRVIAFASNTEANEAANHVKFL
jgi:predicted nuclease of predicted toxin-antitoxin system